MRLEGDNNAVVLLMMHTEQVNAVELLLLNGQWQRPYVPLPLTPHSIG